MFDRCRAFLLQQGLECRLSPSTLKVHAAAISACHDHIDAKSIGKHDLVVRFLRGVRRLNPPRPPSIPSWDLALVLRALQIAPFEPLQSADLRILSMKTLLLVALASIKRVGDLQAFSTNCWRIVPRVRAGWRPRGTESPAWLCAQGSYHSLQGPGSEPTSAAPGGGRPSPGFALSSSRLATIHRQNSKPQDLRPALCLLRRPAEGKGCLQAEEGPLDSGCHCLGLPSSRRALPTQVACPLYERHGILLGVGSWHLADRYL